MLAELYICRELYKSQLSMLSIDGTWSLSSDGREDRGTVSKVSPGED
jgi:hypothetical protein